MRMHCPPAVVLALLGALAAAPANSAPASTSKSTTSSAVAATSKNLLANPGFEQGIPDHPWMAAAWDTFQSGLPTVFFGRDTVLAHGGRWAVSVANLSTYVPMFHNWSQTLVVGREMQGKDVTFSVWTRSNGLQGRAYILVQAYRDTVTKMARTWKVDRDAARARLKMSKSEDPLVNLGWDRQYFSEPETDWVRREVRIFVPPSVNVLVVRCGIFGIGQVMFDDASLTASPAKAPEPLALKTNLIKDPGFEGSGDDWEYSMPPYEGLVIERDSTVFHSGHSSIRMGGGEQGPVSARAGVCQVIANRSISGKRLRLSAWVKTDSLLGQAYVKVYCSTLDGDVHEPTPAQFGLNTDWTQTVMEVDAPPGTYMVWAWVLFNCPASGKLYWDDVSLEVLGTADYITKGTPPPKALPLPAR
jgi:hypothetical protein